MTKRESTKADHGEIEPIGWIQRKEDIFLKIWQQITLVLDVLCQKWVPNHKIRKDLEISFYTIPIKSPF